MLAKLALQAALLVFRVYDYNFPTANSAIKAYGDGKIATTLENLTIMMVFVLLAMSKAGYEDLGCCSTIGFVYKATTATLAASLQYAMKSLRFKVFKRWQS